VNALWPVRERRQQKVKKKKIAPLSEYRNFDRPRARSTGSAIALQNRGTTAA
jgi:hypothetical protein